MKTLFSIITIGILNILWIILNNNLNIYTNTNILSLITGYILLSIAIIIIVVSIYKIIIKIINDIKSYLSKDMEDYIEQILSCIRLNKEAINLHNTTISNNIIHTIITDSQLHHEKSIVLLNNNLIKSHSIHEVLKELFMLEQDTNKLLHFDVDNNPNDLLCKQVIADNINKLEQIKEEVIIEDILLATIEQKQNNSRKKK